MNPTVQDGLQLEHAGRFDEAEQAYRRALRDDPSDRYARTCIGFLHLARGDYAKAWPLLESRGMPAQAGPTPPRWRGQSLKGKTIAVTLEGGLGDQIQFARWLPKVRARGARYVVVVCPKPLERLFARIHGVEVVGVAVEGQHAQVKVPFMPDCYVELCSLPHIFEARPYSVPAPPYLSADPAEVERWRPRLPSTPGLRVGLVWRGSPTNVYDRWRSLPGLATLAPLARVPGVEFVSLQKGAGEDEARAGLPGMRLTHVGSAIENLADSAAILAQLDLLISIDSAPAHLAGALGRPLWVLADKVPDWRWRTAETVRVWYPTARVFHQHRSGEWAGAVEDVANALEELAR